MFSSFVNLIEGQSDIFTKGFMLDLEEKDKKMSKSKILDVLVSVLFEP